MPLVSQPIDPVVTVPDWRKRSRVIEGGKTHRAAVLAIYARSRPVAAQLGHNPSGRAIKTRITAANTAASVASTNRHPFDTRSFSRRSVMAGTATDPAPNRI